MGSERNSPSLTLSPSGRPREPVREFRQTNGDGILLDGNTLYVVRNRNSLIAVVELEPDATQGEVVREITNPEFDVPTTVAEFGNSLYAVNARFGTDDPESAEYNVIRVSK